MALDLRSHLIDMMPQSGGLWGPMKKAYLCIMFIINSGSDKQYIILSLLLSSTQGFELASVLGTM